MIDDEEVVARMCESVGRADLDDARRALEVTLIALAAALDPVEAEALAGELPPRLAAAVRQAERGAAPWTDEPFADLAEREQLSRGLATEYAHVACHLLADRISPEVLQLLGRRLPAPWRDLMHHRAAELPPPPHVHAPAVGDGHTLASGRPGSRHAVADHGVDAAHAESVARSANPHGEEKLSSGTPSNEPIATTHPHTRPIADDD